MVKKRVSKSTIERRNYLFEKIYKEGITIEQARKFTLKQWNDFFNVNVGSRIKQRIDLTEKQKKERIEKSLKGQKRILKQLQDNKDIQLKYYFEKNKIRNERVIEFTKSEFDNIFLESKVILEKKDKDLTKTVKYPERTRKAYGIVEIEHESGKTTFIKFENQQSLERQLNILKRNYGKIINLEFHGLYDYTEYISKEFTDLLTKVSS